MMRAEYIELDLEEPVEEGRGTESEKDRNERVAVRGLGGVAVLAGSYREEA